MSEKVVALSPRNVKLLPCVVYGSAFAMLVFYCIRSGWISHPMLDRYVMGHPVSNVETVMLCVGLLALAMKTVGLLQEQQMLAAWEEPRPEELPFLEEDWAKSQTDLEPGERSTEDTYIATAKKDVTAVDSSEDYLQADALLRVLELRQALNRPQSPAGSTLTQRMTSVLKFIHSRRSADGVDDHLKHLAGQDADAQHDSYSLIRLMVWAIPMLGFLGTVIGISEALGGLDLGDGADLSVLITNLKSSLYVAFDTTALALTYGVILMFFQFGLDRTESSFMQKVDRRTEDFILTSFATTEEDRDPVAKSIQRMGQALLKATFGLVEHQHDLWNESLTAAQDAWISATENSQKQADHVLHEVVDGASNRMVDKLTDALSIADKQLHHRWHQWQITLSDNARSIANFQANATSHIEMLQQFFQTATNLSDEQQQSIKQLVSRLDELVVQSKSLQEHQVAEQKQRLELIEAQKQRERKEQKEKEQFAEIQREGIRWIAENHPQFTGPISPSVVTERLRRQEQEVLEAACPTTQTNSQSATTDIAEVISPSEVVSSKKDDCDSGLCNIERHGRESCEQPNDAADNSANSVVAAESIDLASVDLKTVVETAEAKDQIEQDITLFSVDNVFESKIESSSIETDSQEIESQEIEHRTNDVAKPSPAVENTNEPVGSVAPEFTVRPQVNEQWAIWDTFATSKTIPVAKRDPVSTQAELESNYVDGLDPVAEPNADSIDPNLYVTRFAESSRPPASSEIVVLSEIEPVPTELDDRPVNSRVTSQELASLRIHRDQEEHHLPQISLIPVPEEKVTVSPVAQEPPVNSNIRSMLIPFSDAKVQRAS